MTLIKYSLDLLGLLFCAELFYIAFAYTNSLFISTKKEYNKNSKYFRGLLYSGSWEMIYFSGSRPHVTGKEKLPKDSRFVIVCNHRSNFDPVITWYALRKYDLAYISKPENFKVFTYGKIIRRCCFIPLIRGNPRLAIRYAKRIINEHQGMTPTMIAPGTKVYELVEELVKYLPEDVKHFFFGIAGKMSLAFHSTL